MIYSLSILEEGVFNHISFFPTIEKAGRCGFRFAAKGHILKINRWEKGEIVHEISLDPTPTKRGDV